MLTERFTIVSEEEQFKWELDPPELAIYTNDHFTVFIQEKNLEDNILIKTPMPSNIQEVKKIDIFVLQLLKEKH